MVDFQNSTLAVPHSTLLRLHFLHTQSHRQAALGLNTLTMSNNEDVSTQLPVGRIVGGSDAASTLASVMTTLTTLTGTSPHELGTHVHSMLRSSPHTTFQIVLGSTLHLTHMLGLTPYRALLFHPRLFLAPRFQLWRGVTSFGVLGLNLIDVVRSAVGMVYWQAPLERWFDGDGDIVRDGIVVRQGRNRMKKDGSRKNALEWLILDNHYLRAQVLSGIVLIGIELALHQTPTATTTGARLASSLLIFPYPMYANLEHALRWLWAVTTPTNTMTVFGVLPVRPVYLPFALCALGGFGAWKEMLKGLVAAIVVGKLMDLRRVDGENAVDWLYRTALSWVLWGQRAIGGKSTTDEARPPPKSLSQSVSGFFSPTVAPTDPRGGRYARNDPASSSYRAAAIELGDE
ncbi:hypothetical protein PhCBS80983_g01050 [Powellomyces hirtus]|uniref:Uncharacterized protein n=1 Tax=Powellomyces hirtus TaxID=109895 RepID=A0A507EDU1_9FUNG|nr:hypothetical protein PhCBS80983_g01050 [Powellomyces hirtus]